MIKFIRKRRLFLYLVCITALILLNTVTFQFYQNQNLQYSETDKRIKSSRIVQGGRQWLDNPTFTGVIDPWFPNIEGDTTDVSTSYTASQANLEISGDRRTFSAISGTPREEDWDNVTNPFFPALPDFYAIDEYGCEVNHTWIDPNDPIQAPSIHWERIVTMPVDMSDYKITNASISAVFNASVTTSPGGAGSPNDYYGVDSRNDVVPQPGDYDTARFYVLLSDLADSEIYEVAWYQTVDLGQDSPEISNITDSFMNVVVEEALIFYLTSLFDRDNYQFKITLGIRIKCIDNFNYDRDRWDSLRIKECNLSFIYEKRINQFTSLSWNQEGNEISGDNVYVTGANLTFKYKIDQDWPEALSPNSEIRILLNNNSHSETINLNLATTSFQDAKPEGFDVGYLILKDVNITLSIQLYLADEFIFNDTIMVSIDDVYLYISYITVYDDFLSEPEIFRLLLILALIAAAALGTYFILYQRIFKYPLPVRKVRKYRKTLNKTETPRTSITDSGTSFSKLYTKELNKTSKFMRVSTKEEYAKPSEKLKKLKSEPIKTNGGGS
ncbi:MAG: hypothetical protein ACFE96_15465 [Candidatus Hermodarchaeota archaeon]